MKKILGLSLIAAIALSSNVLAEETSAADASKFSVSGNAALTTNYLWRGISYTKSTGTGQAGLDFSNLFDVKGVYFGLWGSGIQEGSEIDFYTGFSNELGSGLSYDVGYIYYHYTLGADKAYTSIGGAFAGGAGYGEAYIGLSYADYGVKLYQEDDLDGLTGEVSATFGPVDVAAGYYHASDVADFSYGSVGVNWPCMLDNSYNMNATVAYNSGATQSFFNTGVVSGSTFALTISKDF